MRCHESTAPSPAEYMLWRTQRALSIVQFILETDVLKAQAQLYQPWQFSRVLGPRQSVFDTSDEALTGEVNESLNAIGGIPTSISDGRLHPETPVSLIRWHGSNPNKLDQHAWTGNVNGMAVPLVMSISDIQGDLLEHICRLEQS